MRVLTLLPSTSMNETNCELTFVQPQVIDTRLALEQHSAYRQCLENLGFKVICLPANEDLPDSVFIEDPVVILDELAVLTLPFSPSRKGEVPNIEREISTLRRVERIQPPGTLEGGDVMSIGRTLYVGLSTRTNQEGIDQFRNLVEPAGYQVVPVRVHGALHLKTAVTALGSETLLMNRAWFDPEPFQNFAVLEVSSKEPFAANTISIGRRVLMHEEFTETRRLLEVRGFEVITVNISEFLKAEAGLTCMSVRF
ncbi:MAG: dimethylargininase [Proteobacteria bacterium]|nr:MAG: dimethylargininase [Pseudomonadota bacterium]